MPSYMVTDSVTGKKLKLTGDSPPTEQELSSIFEQYRTPQQQRPDLLRESIGSFKQGLTAGPSPLGPLGQFGKAGLQAYGGIQQRAEAALANPELLEGADQFNPVERIQAMGRGLSGQELGEFGDVARKAGVPEPVAAGLGLAGASVMDPLQLGKTAKVTSTIAARKAAGKLGEGTIKAQTAFLLQKEPAIADHIIESRARAFTNKFMDPDRVTKQGNVAKRVIERTVYKPAHEAWEQLTSGPITRQALPADRAFQIQDDLMRVLNDNPLATEAEKDTVRQLLFRLSSVKPKDNPIKTLGQLVVALKPLRKASRESVVLADTVRAATKGIKGLSPEYDRAVDLWADWVSTIKTYDNTLGRTKSDLAGDIPSSGPKILDFFSPKDSSVRRRLTAMTAMVDKKAPGVGSRLLEDIKDTVVAQNFRSVKPSFQSLQIAGMAGVGTAFAGGPGTAKIVGTGLAALSSPKLSAGLMRGAFKSADWLRMNTPLAKTKAQLMAQGLGATAVQGITATANPLIEAGIARQLTGRNE